MYSSIVRYTGCTATFDRSIAKINSNIPSTCVPIEIRSSTTSIIATHTNKIRNNDIPSITIQISNIDDSINHAPPRQFHHLRNYQIHDIDKLISCFETQDKATVSVADWGCREGRGSFGVAVVTMTEELYSIEGPAPENDELMTSLRTEGYGMLAGINLLSLFLRTHTITLPMN